MHNRVVLNVPGHLSATITTTRGSVSLFNTNYSFANFTKFLRRNYIECGIYNNAHTINIKNSKNNVFFDIFSNHVTTKFSLFYSHTMPIMEKSYYGSF